MQLLLRADRTLLDLHDLRECGLEFRDLARGALYIVLEAARLITHLLKARHCVILLALHSVLLLANHLGVMAVFQ